MPHQRAKGPDAPPHPDDGGDFHHNLPCCVPTGCQEEAATLAGEEYIKVICNNEHCQENTFMHKTCFDQWEETVLTYLRSTGRARSWSEKQRLQNLWTKKGYDLAYKACGCKCGKGHLRKDLNWTPPVAAHQEEIAAAAAKKKRQRRKRNDKPTLAITGNVASASSVPSCLIPTPAMPKNVPNNSHNRIRSSSISSTGSGSGSPPSSSSADCPLSPNGGGDGGCGSSSLNGMKRFFADRRERHGSGGNGTGIFTRRQDFSTFNSLPKHKINSYHIKMEDEGTQGNDETRCLILSTLSTKKINRTACILCQDTMLIFDRYPLVDGTFFLSPRQHNKSGVPMKTDARLQYLNAVCMKCLEGWNSIMRCRYCRAPWNGCDLILGTMYSYDVLAATPCCKERLKCNNCHKLIIKPDQRLQYFSDYSHRIPCSHCNVVDYHFVKSLSTYRKDRE